MRNEAGTDPNVPITIPRLARELADQPPLLTAEQMVLLRQSFDHAENGGRQCCPATPRPGAGRGVTRPVRCPDPVLDLWRCRSAIPRGDESATSRAAQC